MKYKILSLLFLFILITSGNVNGQQQRPNILFIMADDHCQQAISSYGSNTIETPHIDRLAREGIRFTNMMVTNSLCAPSRAVLLTGKHSHLNGMKVNRDHFDGSQQTFPKLLQKAGYETCIIGKWHLKTQPEGFDYYSLLDGQGRYYDCPLKETGQPWDGKGQVYKGYLTDVITKKSIEWLETRSEKKPFCLMVHHKAPHGPHDPAPRHETLFEDKIIPEPATLLDKYNGRAPYLIEDKLSSSRMAICRYPQYREEIKKFAGDRDKATRYMYQVYMKGYLRLVQALDENVGRLLDYLDESGLSKNTLVIYTSDNGFFNGEHGFFNKMWMYEPSLKLPFIARLPGMIAPGSTCGALASLPDVTATFLDVAGAKIPDDMQGISIKPLLLGEQEHLHDAVYYHYYEAYNVPEQIGIRTKSHKIIYYPTMPKPYQWELFDLVSDPEEINNQYGEEQFKSVQNRMKNKLKSTINKTGDLVKIEE
jgi:arylsulfatase A-like enzyme